MEGVEKNNYEYWVRVRYEISPKYRTLMSFKDPLLKINVPSKWARGNFISLFDKTQKEIVCPHFWELKPFVGCPFNCSYCYLQGTYYGKKEFRKKNLKGLAKALAEFLKWADSKNLRVLLNAGETTDSLASPIYAKEFLNEILPILRKHKVHKVLLLTKGGTHHIKPLLELNEEDTKFIIPSFSINPPIIFKKFEKGTANPHDRLKAAKILQEKGFKIRIRIDPMIPVEGWRTYYTILVNDMFEKYNLDPEVITIGSLRGLYKTIRFSKDKSWIKYLDKNAKTSWGLKVERKLREEMYTIVIEKIKSYGYNGALALCKETTDVWYELKNRGLLENPGRPGVWENVKCNCKLV